MKSVDQWYRTQRHSAAKPQPKLSSGASRHLLPDRKIVRINQSGPPVSLQCLRWAACALQRAPPIKQQSRIGKLCVAYGSTISLLGGPHFTFPFKALGQAPAGEVVILLN